MKCYLHIGTEKTGTSTLQRFLYLNRETLSRYGYRIPRSLGECKDWYLMVAAYDKGRRTAAMRTLNIRNDRQIELFRQKTVKKLAQECAKAPEPYLILSAEGFQGELRSPAERQRLKDILQEIGCDEITVIVYLRDPAELANSKYSGMVAGGISDPLPPPPDVYRQQCDHRQTLIQWSELFGRENLVVRLYDKDFLHTGSLLDDFMHVIGIPETHDMIIPENINNALSHNALEFIRFANEKVGEGSLYKVQLRKALFGHIVANVHGAKYVMPETLFRAYDDAYKEGNEWVRAHWFADRPALFLRQGRLPASRCDFSRPEIEPQVNQWIHKWKYHPYYVCVLWKRVLLWWLFSSPLYPILKKMKMFLSGKRP